MRARHRNAARPMVEQIPLGPNAMALRERCVAVLLDSGLPPWVAAYAYATLSRYVLGSSCPPYRPPGTAAQDDPTTPRRLRRRPRPVALRLGRQHGRRRAALRTGRAGRAPGTRIPIMATLLPIRRSCQVQVRGSRGSAACDSGTRCGEEDSPGSLNRLCRVCRRSPAGRSPIPMALSCPGSEGMRSRVRPTASFCAVAPAGRAVVRAGPTIRARRGLPDALDAASDVYVPCGEPGPQCLDHVATDLGVAGVSRPLAVSSVRAVGRRSLRRARRRSRRSGRRTSRP
nr:TetR/AcrR family transcriptional regulator C-terminal domain-containing protein [Streptomyces lincolnensis]